MSLTQIKCIANEVSADGLFTLKFSDQILIKANSSIALDKFIYSGYLNASTNIVIDSQTIEIHPDDSRRSKATKRTAQIQAGSYDNVQELMDTVQNQLNLSLVSGGSTAVWSQTGQENGPLKDVGLGFRVYPDEATDNCVIEFVSADNVRPENPVFEGVELREDDNDSVTIIPDAEEYIFNSGAPLLRGGLMIDVRLLDVGNETSVYEVGLCELAEPLPNPPNEPDIKYGIYRDPDGDWFFIDDGEQIEVPDAFPNVHDDYRFIWYINGNQLRFGVSQQDYTVMWVSERDMPTLFSTFNFRNMPSVAYDFAIHGTDTDAEAVPQFNLKLTEQPNVDVNENGFFVKPADHKHHLGVAAQQRLVSLDFNDAKQLVGGLGFAVPVLQFAYGLQDELLAPSAPNFASIPDLALEIMNIPLSNYESKTDHTTNGTRRNVIAYFTPTLQDISRPDAKFFANNNGLRFLSILNKEDMNVSTLQFRLFDALDNLAFDMNYISFTLLIKSPN